MSNSVQASDDVDVLVLAVRRAVGSDVDPGSIERDIERLPGVKHVVMNDTAEVVVVEYLPAQLDASYVIATALSTGWSVEPWFGW